MGGQYLIVIVAVLTSFLTLYSMTKIWSYAFWHAKCRDTPAASFRGMMAPTAVLVLFTIIMGAWAQPFLRIAEDAAHDVVDSQAYVSKVLSEGTQ
jgi:multicomponent Na+:H+ antiporter subunit D